MKGGEFSFDGDPYDAATLLMEALQQSFEKTNGRPLVFTDNPDEAKVEFRMSVEHVFAAIYGENGVKAKEGIAGFNTRVTLRMSSMVDWHADSIEIVDINTLAETITVPEGFNLTQISAEAPDLSQHEGFPDFLQKLQEWMKEN